MGPSLAAMPIAPLFDVAAIVVFVALGRRSHDEGGGIGEVVEIAAPFLIALGVAWAVLCAWRAPTKPSTGVHLAIVTVGVGQTLRNLVFERGTAVAFIIVSAVMVTALFVGWRLVVQRWFPRFASDPTG